MTNDNNSDAPPSGDQADLYSPPTPETLDYAEIALLTLLFLIGAPLNLISLVRCLNASYSNSLLRRLSSTQSSVVRNVILTGHSAARSDQACRQTRLRLHLTIANLITVWAYGLCEIFWLITYSWRGGDMLCRVIQFFYTFCFYATSNLTASIAIDRLCISVYGNGRKRRPSFLKYLHWNVRVSWTLAFISSLPQMFVWRTLAPFPEWQDWYQCVSVWAIAKHQAMIAVNGSEPVDLMEVQEKLYNGFHLAIVFWLPVVVIAGCYVCIVRRLQFTIKETQEEMERRCRFQRCSNFVMFRQHASVLHRPTTLSATNSSSRATMKPTHHHYHKRQLIANTSPILLMELPIVLKIPQGFVCQPLLESYALMTLVRAKWRTVRKTAYILLAYILCWSPYNILALGRYIDPSFENAYLEVCSNLIILNAVINPLIYGI